MSAQDKVTIRKLRPGSRASMKSSAAVFPNSLLTSSRAPPEAARPRSAHQFVFANATLERPALYFTVLGESAIKMLRYQQQYAFFDPAKLNDSIRFINLSQVVLEKDLSAVLEEITKEVEKANPAVVVVDSFRTMMRKPQSRLQRDGSAVLHSAVGPVSGQLAGYDLSDRGICRG